MPLIQPLQGSGFAGPKPLQINATPYDPKVTPLTGTGEVVANSLKTRAARDEANTQRFDKGIGAFATQLKENSAQQGMKNVFQGRPYAENNPMAPSGPNPLDGQKANIFFDGKHYYTDPMQVAKIQAQAAATAHTQAGTANTNAQTTGQTLLNDRMKGAGGPANPAGGRNFKDVKANGQNPTNEPPLSTAQPNGTAAPTPLQTTAAGASPVQANGSAAPSALQQAAGSSPFTPNAPSSADAAPSSAPVPDASPIPAPLDIPPAAPPTPPPASNVAGAAPAGGAPMMAGGDVNAPMPIFNQNDTGAGWSFQDFGGAV